MKQRTQKPKTEVIKNTAALLLKQVDTFRSGLPASDLRRKVTTLVSEVEEVVIHINDTFPTYSENDDSAEIDDNS